ncbi:hypothetical protein WA588_001410, partial [Blastocystis sp. NMH]
MTKEEIRAQQEANKNLTQEEKQALRRAKKAEKAAKVQAKLATKEAEPVAEPASEPAHVPTKEEIRAQQEANKNLTQEEKQALRRAKKAEKAAKAQKKGEGLGAVTAGNVQNGAKESAKGVANAAKGVSNAAKGISNAAKGVRSAAKNATNTTKPSQPRESQQLLYRFFSNSFFSPTTSRDLSAPPFNPTAPAGQEGIHPLFLQLGLLMGNREVCGANRRAEYLLRAMKQLLHDVPALPEESALDYMSRISRCVAANYAYIRSVRAPSVPMERLFAEIKTSISFVSDGRASGEETAQAVHDRVESRLNDWGKFLESKKRSIVECLTRQIEVDDVVVTFGESERVTEALVAAARRSPAIRFRVVVIAGRPKINNDAMLRKLVQNRVACTLAPLNALPYVMETATKAIVSASAMLANGSAVADIGTAVVATACQTYHIPLLVVADSFKFSRSVQLDSIAKNELNDSKSFRPTLQTAGKERWVLDGYEDIENLQLINLSYDLVPAALISGIVTEYSIIPATSVASVLRDMETLK